jgi:hypothetical protein
MKRGNTRHLLLKKRTDRNILQSISITSTSANRKKKDLCHQELGFSGRAYIWLLIEAAVDALNYTDHG